MPRLLTATILPPVKKEATVDILAIHWQSMMVVLQLVAVTAMWLFLETSQ